MSLVGVEGPAGSSSSREEEEAPSGYYYDLVEARVGYVFAGDQEPQPEETETLDPEEKLYLQDNILVNSQNTPVNAKGEDLGLPPLRASPGFTLQTLFSSSGEDGEDLDSAMARVSTFLSLLEPPSARDQVGTLQQSVNQVDTEQWKEGKAEVLRNRRTDQEIIALASALTKKGVDEYRQLFAQWNLNQLQGIVVLYLYCRMGAYILGTGITEPFSGVLSAIAEEVFTLMGPEQ